MERQIIIHDITKDEFFAALKANIQNEINVLRNDLNQQTDPDRLLTIDEACEYLGVSRVTLWKYSSEGKIKKHQLGSKVYYKLSSLEAALKPNK